MFNAGCSFPSQQTALCSEWPADEREIFSCCRLKDNRQFSCKGLSDRKKKYRISISITESNLKTMYFGKRNNVRIKKTIKNHLENKQDYTIEHIRVAYDVSFEYNADKQKAWYSEEYRNCGNGHYYLAIDENTAIFCEND